MWQYNGLRGNNHIRHTLLAIVCNNEPALVPATVLLPMVVRFVIVGENFFILGFFQIWI